MGKPLPQNSRLPSTHGLGDAFLSIDHNIKGIMRCTRGFQLLGLKICQPRIAAVLRTFSDVLEASCIDLYKMCIRYAPAYVLYRDRQAL
jgi:hypothetical protein